MKGLLFVTPSYVKVSGNVSVLPKISSSLLLRVLQAQNYKGATNYESVIKTVPKFSVTKRHIMDAEGIFRMELKNTIDYLRKEGTFDNTIIALGSLSAYAFGVKDTLKDAHGLPVYDSYTQCWVVPTYDARTVIDTPKLFPDFYRDIYKAIEIDDGKYNPAEEPIVNTIVLDSFDAILDNYSALTMPEDGVMSVDIETTGLNYETDEIMSVAMCVSEKDVYIVPQSVFEENRTIHFFRELFDMDSITFVFQNGKFDCSFLKTYAIANARCDYDTMLAHYCVDERKGSHGLKSWARDYLHAKAWDAPLKQYKDWKSIPKDLLYKYQSYDVYYTRKGYFLFNKLMEEDGTKQCFDTVYKDAVNAFVDIELGGVRIDEALLNNVHESSVGNIEEARKKIVSAANELGFDGHKYTQYVDEQRAKLWHEENDSKPVGERSTFPRPSRAPAEFNPESSSQLAYVAYKLCGLKAFEGKLTCSKQAIEMYRHTSEFWQLLYEYRSVAGIYGTFVDGMKKRIGQDGRIHPQFLLHGTESGRISCVAPNLQNLPRDSAVKDFFIPDKGHVIINADYKTLEVAVAAILSGDVNMQRPFVEKQDFHTETTKRIFAKQLYELHASIDAMSDDALSRILDSDLNVSIRNKASNMLADGEYKALEETVFKNYRRASKAVTFGVMYGRGAKSLAEHELMCSVGEAETYVKHFFTAYPKYKEFLNKNETSAFTKGYVQNYFGFKRRFPFVTHEERQTMRNQSWNTPVQGAAAQVCLMAVCRLQKRLTEQHLGRVLFTVHDSIVFSIDKGYLEQAVSIIREEMTRDMLNSDVKLDVDIECGDSYGSVVSYEEYVSKLA